MAIAQGLAFPALPVVAAGVEACAPALDQFIDAGNEGENRHERAGNAVVAGLAHAIDFSAMFALQRLFLGFHPALRVLPALFEIRPVIVGGDILERDRVPAGSKIRPQARIRGDLVEVGRESSVGPPADLGVAHELAGLHEVVFVTPGELAPVIAREPVSRPVDEPLDQNPALGRRLEGFALLGLELFDALLQRLLIDLLAGDLALHVIALAGDRCRLPDQRQRLAAPS